MKPKKAQDLVTIANSKVWTMEDKARNAAQSHGPMSPQHVKALRKLKRAQDNLSSVQGWVKRNTK